MKTTLAVVSGILLTVAFELLYERIVAFRTRRKDAEKTETMEQSMNDGCQTSIRMVVFGTISSLIGWYVFRH